MGNVLALGFFNVLFFAVFASVVILAFRKHSRARQALSRMEEEQPSSDVYTHYRETLGDRQTPQALKGALADLEQERKALYDRNKMLAKAGGLTVLVVAALGVWYLNLEPQAGFVILMIGGAAIFILCFQKSNKLRVRAKKQLMERLCGDLGLSYSQGSRTGKIPTYRKLGLLPNFDRSSFSDFIHGKTFAGHPFELVDAELKRRNKSSKKSNNYTTVFSGLLIHVASDSAIEEQVLVKKRRGVKALNPFQSEQKVVLESDDFTDIYDVYASDQVAARRLLTPAIMEKCVELDAKTGGTPQIGFVGGDVYLAIDRGMRSFEVPGISQPWTEDIFERAFSELTFAIEAAGVFDHELQPASRDEQASV